MKYPIYFENGICPHCGKTGLQYMDRSGSIVRNLIYPIQYIVCLQCRRRFFIRWIDKEDKKIPVTCAKSSIHEFEDSISEFSKRSKRKID